MHLLLPLAAFVRQFPRDVSRFVHDFLRAFSIEKGTQGMRYGTHKLDSPHNNTTCIKGLGREVCH